MERDLKKLIKDLRKTFEKHGIKEPAFVIAFTEKGTGHQKAFWASNINRMDSIKITGMVHERLKRELN